MSSPEDPNGWREKAAKALRLASHIGDVEASRTLKALAAEYVERAQALEGKTLAAELSDRPEAVPRQMQQQQQPQPDPEPEKSD